MSQNDLIAITLDFRDFGKGRAQNSDSALVRPFGVLIDEAKPIGRINYLFYRSTRSFVFGALCFTPGRRLLFFPGLVVRSPRWYNKGQETLYPPTERKSVIDHLTLEPDFESYHATMRDSASTKSYLVTYKTRKIVDNLTCWFGLSLQSEKVLEECPERIEFRFRSPPQDSKRRVDIVMQSREDAIFHIVELPPGSKWVPDCFLHFDFLVDLQKDTSVEDLVPELTTAPTSPPALKKPVSVLDQIPVYSHHVTVPEFVGAIWVVTSMRVGELTEQALIGGF